MKVFVDLETTGFSTDVNQIIEIGALAVDDSGEIVDKFHEYIFCPYVPAMITELTGISTDQLLHCRTEVEVLRRFAGWAIGLGVNMFNAYNAPFDKRFLRDRSYYHRLPIDYNDYEWEDSMKLSRALVKKGLITTKAYPDITDSKDGGIKLGQIARALGVEFEAHSAIEDIQATFKCFNIMKEMG